MEKDTTGTFGRINRMINKKDNNKINDSNYSNDNEIISTDNDNTIMENTCYDYNRTITNENDINKTQNKKSFNDNDNNNNNNNNDVDINNTKVIKQKIDIQTQRYPYCLVWTPLPLISWIIPIIGHTGVCGYFNLLYFLLIYLIKLRWKNP